jgi:hypothetical protein
MVLLILMISEEEHTNTFSVYVCSVTFKKMCVIKLLNYYTYAQASKVIYAKT